MIRPFLVLALPRSRTAWLARFLTYREWTCGHEEIRHIREIEDAKSWLNQPFSGSAETAAAPFWRLLPTTMRVVVVRRPVADVVESLMRLDTKGAGQFDREALTKLMIRLDRKLQQIEARVPNVISASFSDLAEEETCKRIFEHCLPYPHDHEWWKFLAPLNLQAPIWPLLRYFTAFRPQMDRAAKITKHAMLKDMALRQPTKQLQGVEFNTESFETFYKDGQRLFADHLYEVGEAPDAFAEKNLPLMKWLDDLGAMQILTARSNGRMFGYLMTEICPSRESPKVMSAVQTTFYASPVIPGLGMRLQRESLRRLSERGINEVFFRAGSRGDGPRMGSLYKRLGAAEDGQLYRVSL